MEMLIMTTDDKDNKTIAPETNVESTKTDEKSPSDAAAPEIELSATEKALVDRMSKIFEDKLASTVDKYDKEITELKKSVDDKDKEIAKLRKVNSEILMATDLTGNKEDNVDFNDVEFNEVNWDSQVKATLDAIDKRIS